MMIGSAKGSDVPWSFSFISFIAMENSNLSIFPSLFISARALRDKKKNRESSKSVEILKYRFQRISLENPLLKNLSVCVYFSHHISANTEAGSPDWRKNFLACSPTERHRKGRNRETQEN